ncbi:MAG TPA: methyltransferase domain-containing protein [Flavisolibacter sp.]|jgi:ubiquinone/menaquinone biosynthesis C-methylase UbiE|nr:methyltransferase domain-containing protein [Flavisolibacter sp.]
MSVLVNHINELKAAEAFTKQSTVFDQLYNNDVIIQYKRERVREHILKYARPGCAMLELNCGSGEDAIYFAKKGFAVHATDASTGMLEVLKQKITKTGYNDEISFEECSFTELERLQVKQSFDYVYSNFGGLNCTSELEKVLSSLNAIVNTRGVVTLVVISKFCLWETLMLFKGKFKTAVRRLFSGKGRKAHVEGKFFKCWYYSPSFIKRHLQPHFDLLSVEGLCTIVPPSYIEKFGEKYPKALQYLKQKEDRLKDKWPWKFIGDYFIISIRKKI